MARVARLGVVIDSSGAKKGAREANDSLDSMSKTAERTMDTFKKAANAIGISLAGIGLAKLIGEAQDFEKQMALISTVLDETTGSTVVFREELRKMFRSLPVASMGDLSKGMYDIISAGIPAGDAVKYLDVAARAAIAGVTSTATAVDALTTATNAWRKQSLTAQQASDQMFMAVNKGKMTFEELSAAIGTIAPIAAGYGISLQDVLGATAQLTLSGLSASEAMVGIRSAITNVINPTSEFAKEFPALAKEFNATKLEAVGFTEFLIQFNKAAGGSKEAINSMFTDVQGKTAVFSLLSDAGRGAAEQVANVGKAAGASEVALGKIANTSAAAAQLLKNQFKDATTELATQALPAVNAGMSMLTDALAFIRENGPAVAAVVSGIATGFAAYAVAVRASATWTAILGAAQTIQAFLSLAATIRSAADAMALLSMVGKGAVGAVVAIAAVTAGFVAYKAATSAMAADTKKFNDELARVAKGAGTVVGPTKDAAAATRDAEAAAKAAADAAKKHEQAEARKADAIKESARIAKIRTEIEKEYQGQWVTLGIQLAEDAAEAERNHAAAIKESATQLAAMLSKRAQSNKLLQDQVTALMSSRRAYDDVVNVQERLAAMTDALNDAQQNGVLLNPAMLLMIGSQVAEGQRLLKLKQALLDLDGESPFKIPVEDTKEWGAELNIVANTVKEIAQIFGNVGTELTKGIQLATQLAQSISAANRAAAVAAAAKGTAKEGETGAASRAAQLAAGATIATVAVTAISMWSNSTKQAAEEARQMAVALREARIAAKASAAAFVASANNTALQKELDSITASFGDVVAKLIAAGAPRVERLGNRTAVNVVPTAKDVNDVIDAYEKMIAAAKRAAEFAAAQAEGELQARALAAAGRTGEAEAIRQQLRNEKELEEARLSTADATASAAAVERLRGIQAAEAAQRAAKQAAERTAFGLDLTQRRQALNGDDRGAFQTGQTIAMNAALAQAQQLFDAGTITAEMFAELKKLLGDEMVAALQAFDVAAQKAKQTMLDDLNVRALIAQGRESEAAQARIEIANAQELSGVTDKALRAQIEYVQGLEATARVTARAAELQQKLYDIDTRMIDALRTLDPAKAEELENARMEAARAKELDEAGSKLVKTRLQELFAMEDAAIAQAKLTAELERQKRAAEALTNFTSSVEVDYLRATGRSFDADVKVLKDDRDKRLQEAKDLNATQETIRQINATFDAKYSALIATQLGSISAPTSTASFDTRAAFSSGGAGTDSSTLIGEGTTSVQSTRSITESTAVQMVDYLASSNALLRRLVQIAEGQSGSTGDVLASPSLMLADRVLGARSRTAGMLLSGSVR